MRRPETQRQGSPRGLDTRRSGRQVSTPSIRFSRSYPQTRDGVAFHTPSGHAALNAAFVTAGSETRGPHPDREVVMAADFFLGESLGGDGNEFAHIDLIIGSRSGHAGHAFVSTLANNTDGFTNLLTVGTPNLSANTGPLSITKDTIKHAS